MIRYLFFISVALTLGCKPINQNITRKSGSPYKGKKEMDKGVTTCNTLEHSSSFIISSCR